ALFVMTCALAVLATPLTSWAVELLAAIIGAYVTCNLIASIAVARRHGWRHLVRLLLIFAILHVAYGLGFVAGLARFSRRWRERRGLTPHSADADRRMKCAPGPWRERRCRCSSTGDIYPAAYWQGCLASHSPSATPD